MSSINLVISRTIDNTIIMGDPNCTSDIGISPLKYFNNNIVYKNLDYCNSLFVVDKKYKKYIPYIPNGSKLYILDPCDTTSNNTQIIKSIVDIKNLKNNNKDKTINIFCFDAIIKYIGYIDYIYEIIYATKQPYKILKKINNYEILTNISKHKIIYKSINGSVSIIMKKYILNNQEYQYLDLVKNIYNNGDDIDDRTGYGVKCLNGKSITFNISNNFPMITTKFTSFKCILYEFLWFMAGSTDNSILQENGIHIWDGNTSKESINSLGLNYDEHDGGTIYGYNFRHYGAKYTNCKTTPVGGIDQVQQIVNGLRKNPTSRRHIINLWDPSTLDNAVLPPCHMVYQFLSNGEYLDCIMFQRSADVGLGLPFNIASVALFTYTIASLTNLYPRNITIHLGNSHIYNNHTNLKNILNRDPLSFPTLEIVNREQQTIDDFTYDDFILKNYNYHPKIVMSMNV